MFVYTTILIVIRSNGSNGDAVYFRKYDKGTYVRDRVEVCDAESPHSVDNRPGTRAKVYGVRLVIRVLGSLVPLVRYHVILSRYQVRREGYVDIYLYIRSHFNVQRVRMNGRRIGHEGLYEVGCLYVRLSCFKAMRRLTRQRFFSHWGEDNMVPLQNGGILGVLGARKPSPRLPATTRYFAFSNIVKGSVLIM